MNKPSPSRQNVISRRTKQAFALFAVIGGFFIVAEHRAHLIPYLPWLFLAACPLIHIFMHHGHGGHQRHGNGDEPGRQRKAASASGSTVPPSPGFVDPRSTSQHQHGDRS